MKALPLSDSETDRRSVLGHALIREAGARALQHFGNLAGLTVEAKLNGQDVVSHADRDVEALIRAGIAASFPDDGFLGEEGGHAPGTSGYSWIVDPIDGTSCFLHGISNWCISIALAKHGTTVAGFILDPSADELFSARHGRGAFLNGQPLRVRESQSITDGLTGIGANFRVPVAVVPRFIEALLIAGGMFIRNGSGALMLAHVACGRLVAYYEPHINAWDCLAGLLLVREAGGWTAAYPPGEDLLAGGPVVAATPAARNDLLALIETATR